MENAFVISRRAKLRQRFRPVAARLRQIPQGGIVAAAAAALVGLIAFNAWVCEDAYITFRVVDNFLHGYGLRWNVHERVQVYTHPLWLLLHLPLVAVWPNIFHANMALSVTCSAAAIAFTLLSFRRPAVVALGCFLLPLALSKSFIDYAASGLENPLGYLLYACFGFVLVKKYDHPRFWFYLSLAASLGLLNRFDTIILYAPALAYVFFIRGSNIDWRGALLGALPLIGWCAFALFYYGFIFPNTKYAKLGTGLDLVLYLRQGFHYAKYLLVWDTAGAVVMASSLLFIIHPRSLSIASPPGLPQMARWLALGIYAYFFYVITIGGDYMAGRFWAMPVFAAAWLWHAFCPARLRRDVVFLLLCALLTAYLTPPLLGNIRQSCSNCIPLKGRVIDAARIFGNNRLVASAWPLKLRQEGRYNFARQGKDMQKQEPPPVKSMWYIGMIGYYAGPRVIIIDELGLADPLLARLPAAKQQNFYVGHFRRDIPIGYRYALAHQSLERMDPMLANYYSKLQLITEGDLWDSERLKTIALFNIGLYDYWKEDYVSHGL